MEEKLLNLKKNIKADFWLSPDGDIIYSNICTLYPKDYNLLFDLGLAVDTYMANLSDCPRLRFFKSCFK